MTFCFIVSARMLLKREAINPHPSGGRGGGQILPPPPPDFLDDWKTTADTTEKLSVPYSTFIGYLPSTFQKNMWINFLRK